MHYIFLRLISLFALLSVSLGVIAAEEAGDKLTQMRETLARREEIRKDYAKIVLALEDSAEKAKHVKGRLLSMVEPAKAGKLSDVDKAALAKVEELYRIPQGSTDTNARIATAIAAAEDRVVSQTKNRDFALKHMKENLFQLLKLEKEIAAAEKAAPVTSDKPAPGRVKTLIDRFERIAEENK